MAEPSSAADLYGLDPTDFTAARDALARSLRADGHRDEAAEVKKLRRPPQSVWALNLLARTEPELIDAVLEAATGLRDALEDGGADRRAAQNDYRDAIDRAVAAAASGAGIAGDDMRMRIRTNLLAAGVDEVVAVQLQQGVLPDDQEAPGFGGTPTIGPITRPSGTRRAKSGAPTARSGGRVTPSKAAARDRKAIEGEARDRKAEADARARAEADELSRRRVARQRAELEREISRLEKKAARLNGQAEAAEERAATAREEAEEATAALADATERLGKL